jgi:hypothetical protein
MWRRACLGEHDDAVTLLLVWAAAVLDVLLLGATARGWTAGLMAATVAGTLAQGAFWWRRHRWDRFVRRQWLQGVAEAESLLQRHSR